MEIRAIFKFMLNYFRAISFKSYLCGEFYFSNELFCADVNSMDYAVHFVNYNLKLKSTLSL